MSYCQLLRTLLHCGLVHFFVCTQARAHSHKKAHFHKHSIKLNTASRRSFAPSALFIQRDPADSSCAIFCIHVRGLDGSLSSNSLQPNSSIRTTNMTSTVHSAVQSVDCPLPAGHGLGIYLKWKCSTEMCVLLLGVSCAENVKASNLCHF